MPQGPRARALDPLLAAAAVLPPLLLAVAGLVHPLTLTASTANRWVALHLLLLPVFPLLGLGPWAVTRGSRRLRAATVVLGFIYAVFYGALDILAGIGTGTLVHNGYPGAARSLFTVGNDLSYVGVAAFVLASVVACTDTLRRCRWPAALGAIVVAACAVSFLSSHIYWPRGVLTQLGLAFGWGWLYTVSARSSRQAQTVTNSRGN